MSTQPAPAKSSVAKPLMSNHAKLIIIVLGFFLALTYVRAFTLEADSSEIIFSGNQPYSFPVVVTNPSNTPLTPNFIADGPFVIILPGDVPTISAHDSETFVLRLVPSPAFNVGDVYTGQIRVVSIDGETSFPLTFRMKNAPLFSTSNVTGLFSFASFTALPLVSSINWIDGLLILIVIILAIALVARVKNRVIGG